MTNINAENSLRWCLSFFIYLAFGRKQGGGFYLIDEVF